MTKLVPELPQGVHCSSAIVELPLHAALEKVDMAPL
jgi:hypothetical protein